MSIIIESVQTGSYSMNYFRFGKGKRTLVILPGLSISSVMGSADTVAAAYGRFRKDYTVYVFDRRTELPAEYSVRDMARDTAEVMDLLGLRKVCLFGASQGGMIAMIIAALRPDLVGRLALGSASAHETAFSSGTVSKWIALAEKGDCTGLYLSFGEMIYPAEVFRRCRDALVEAAGAVTDEDLKRFGILARGIRGFDALDDIGRIECPVLVLGARDDAVLGPDAAEEIFERLDRSACAEIHIYEGHGHAAFDTAPDYRRRLYDFFGRNITV
ncbi:MAG: alpha/beta hydrolase [Clostridia bacterium]|nr:alpha/beta hydrolase [Clostridia bacterium]